MYELDRAGASLNALSLSPFTMYLPRVFSVVWARSRNRFVLRILFCKAVDLHATLPEDFCIVFSTTFTGFIQLS